jgi:3'-phosphoadenosine 5'-phosphosulfate sulfotransferase (PAPS reductase)/FAD synthetase
LYKKVKDLVNRPFEEKLEESHKLIICKLKEGLPCISCSFGKDSMAVLHLVRLYNPKVPVVFNNTNIQWPETYEFRDQIKKEWNLKVFETRPIKTFWNIGKEYGLPDGSKWKRRKGKDNSMDRCCWYLKHLPMRRFMKSFGFNYAFSGVTAVESRQRMLTACQYGSSYFAKRDGYFKVNPIAYWTQEEVWRFTKEENIPINPAYKNHGLTRLGCMFCTAYKDWREILEKNNPKMIPILEKFMTVGGNL